MAAEILRGGEEGAGAHEGFNEAAANGRGNRTCPSGSGSTTPCFNEAAANGRGNLLQDFLCRHAVPSLQ